jgi:hypothetical protein
MAAPVGETVGEPEPAIDLTSFGPADPAYLNGIVAHPGGKLLLVASQGEGGTLWRIDLVQQTAARVDLGGYEFNADGMLVYGGVLYGVTNRGETRADVRFMISAARLEPDWVSGAVLGEMTDPGWDFPTTIAQVGGQMLVVCSQVAKKDAGIPPSLPFRVVSVRFPEWS